MIVRKKIEKHVEEQIVEDYTVCDICGKKIINRGYDADEINIEGLIGSCYPEGDCRTGYRLDICSDCFLDKIKPLIEQAYGIEFTKYNVESFTGYYNDQFE